jgi:hypothetical protein
MLQNKIKLIKIKYLISPKYLTKSKISPYQQKLGKLAKKYINKIIKINQPTIFLLKNSTKLQLSNPKLLIQQSTTLNQFINKHPHSPSMISSNFLIILKNNSSQNFYLVIISNGCSSIKICSNTTKKPTKITII